MGLEFQVNSYTTGSQSLASAATGSFIVIWQGSASAGTDSSSNSVQGQRFAGVLPMELQQFRAGGTAAVPNRLRPRQHQAAR